MACSVCGGDGHNSRTCDSAPDCVGCGESIRYGHMDFNGQDWHEACFEVSDGPRYCCGMMYDEGEYVCASCGESL